MVLACADLYRKHPVCREKRAGTFQDIDWPEFEASLHSYARGLMQLGVKPQERVAIMAPNGPNWVYADLAIQACGAVSVPVYHTEGLQNILYILEDSESRHLFIWSPVVAEDLLLHQDDIPHLEKIILLKGRLDHPKVINLEKFLSAKGDDFDAQVNTTLSGLDADELASIVYTSGTTGPPKGVMLTHRNFISNVTACSKLFDIGPTDTCLSFLPLSHVFERMAGYYMMLNRGATIAYAESIDSVPANMLEVRPTVMISVPRLYEKMFSRVMERVVASRWLKRKLFLSALSLCKKRLALEQEKQPVSWGLCKITDLARRAIFSKLREPLGGQLRFFVSGGAPLTRQVAEFFLAAGIDIYEGYGLTETSPVIAANHAGAIRLGTVGRPLPGTEVKLGKGDEILASGPGIFLGYWRKPEQTREVLTDGWFHTGDIGELDNDGFLSITDRKKDLIVTAGGENVAPQVIEKVLKADKFIANIMVYGDRRPFLSALLVPNFDYLARYAKMKKIDFLTNCDLVNHPRVLNLVRKRIETLQAELPHYQQIRRFTLLSRDFSAEDGEVTPTLKLRRKVVAQKFRQVIEGMYLATDHGIHDAGFCIIDPPTEE
jgi:long-chain acyl-CoA synthetase